MNFIQIMAVVHQYIIIYFTLVIHDTMSDYLSRNLCLETVLGFINNDDICYFDSSTALDILQDDTTCPNKCNIQMYNLNSDSTYSLKRIDLTIGDEIKFFRPCLESLEDKKIPIYQLCIVECK